MIQLSEGATILGMRALSYSDSESGTTTYEPDSYLLLTNEEALLITSATDWTLRVETVSWPDLPDWAWPPTDWRYEEVESPIGRAGYQTVKLASYLHNEVGEVDGLKIEFEQGSIEFRSGDSVVFTITA